MPPQQDRTSAGGAGGDAVRSTPAKRPAPTDRTDHTGCFSMPPLPPTGLTRGEREPKNQRLHQQALGACKPLLDTVWVVFIFLAIGMVLIPIGAVCVAFGNMPPEVSQRYDQTCFSDFTGSSNEDRQSYIWQNAANDPALTCTLTFNITTHMKAPIMVFYQLNGFNMNNYRFVQSRSYTQLVDHKNAVVSQCKPQLDYNGSSAQQINPCGLTAWTYFNDSYSMQLTRSGQSPGPLPISTTNIASLSDRNHMYKDYQAQYFNPEINSLRGGANLTVPVGSDDGFMIWMRLAPLPKFLKLYGIINGTDLYPGDQVTVTVVNRYNSFSFDGSKTLVLTTTTWLGTRNTFMGGVFLFTGGLSVLAGAAYLITASMHPGSKGPPKIYSSWLQETGH